MILLPFSKYQATGNDFIMIDNRNKIISKYDTKLFAMWCHRRFGIGADGLILLENDQMSDFKMVYFNSDGNQSSMCGNGGRSMVQFAKQLGIIQNNTTFMAIDGLHEANIYPDGLVQLKMTDVSEVQNQPTHCFLNTGSPHHVELTKDVANLEVSKIGAKIRYSGMYGEAGANVNFVEPIDENTFLLRTYERGVEDETYSCGTGATAAAIAMHYTKQTSQHEIHLQVLGGKLTVQFTPTENGYEQVYLTGPAEKVFDGFINYQA